MILRNFNIYGSSAANLVHVEKALSEKLRIWLRLFFLLVKMDDKGNSKTSIFSLFIKPDQVLLPWHRHTCPSKYGCFCSSYLHMRKKARGIKSFHFHLCFIFPDNSSKNTPKKVIMLPALRTF